MIDFAGLPATPTAADFVFRVGNDSDPSGWVSAPVPTSIVARAGAGVGGSSRVELIWADGAIVNTWLQITVKASPATCLAQADVL